MSCLGRVAVPVKRVWRGLSARLRLRRATGKSSSSSASTSSYYAPMDTEVDDDVGALAAGLGRLRKEVRTCEYSDVHVMWEMLSSSNGGGGGRSASARAAAGRGGSGGGGGGKGSRRCRVGRKAAVAWSRLASYCCAF
ncbi:hypothetical protein HU200_027841 [Digitaria exilis]|uniref:Uncharacterized protein n=1 Tax=Digitaria exilis TaxID=1010633 RepID=A0A835BVK1_9POAL|nr:hypothetical protein HU200_027841 [Digitaria exilis]